MQEVAIPMNALVSDPPTKDLGQYTHRSFRSHLHSQRPKAIGCQLGRYKLASVPILHASIIRYVFANAPVAADVSPIGW